MLYNRKILTFCSSCVYSISEICFFTTSIFLIIISPHFSSIAPPLFFQLCQCTLCLNYRYINCARQFFLSQNYLHNFLTSSTVFCAIDAICSSETPAFHMERIISLLPSSFPIRSPSSLPIRLPSSLPIRVA